MKVTIEPSSGFCGGVRKAINRAEKEAELHAELYSLGELVHNESETGRLRTLGIQVINQEQFARLKDQVVLIRAHGEPPATFETARKNNLTLIDATCPIVKKIQRDVYETWQDGLDQGVQIAIFGKKDHPEVKGLAGQCNGNAIVISEEDDLYLLDFSRPLVLFSQTTVNPVKYLLIQDTIRELIRKSHPAMEEHFQVRDTICRQVSRLAGIFDNFARQHQMIIFVSGKESSNGRYLFGLCKSGNPNTYLISGIDELEPEWFTGIQDVGICGSTSSPLWLLEEIAAYIEKSY